jgi:opacity protein-like surface antigen
LYISAKADASKLYAPKNFIEEPMDVGFGGAVGLQYKFAKDFRFRTELELSFNSFDSKDKRDDPPYFYIEKSHDYKQTALLANLYIERDHGWKLKPYGMIGVGIASYKENATKNTYIYSTDTLNSDKYNDKSNSFAYAFGAGVSFGLMRNLQGDIGVRYMITSQVAILSPSAAIRYVF